MSLHHIDVMLPSGECHQVITIAISSWLRYFEREKEDAPACRVAGDRKGG
jgi:hypothetical protein